MHEKIQILVDTKNSYNAPINLEFQHKPPSLMATHGFLHKRPSQGAKNLSIAWVGWGI